ncbi:hypothetical protein [Streptomyces indicus]|uniref:Uncharacterized protein n=1 Tax=Streptomyces indicus TaxID=417292 RepID=A0A1G9H1Y9_9ACTN|nr:hypothetical protein [Streptomyces indicus]SDL06966.1 hypothetical protein SAMN05421806_117155 [Streptomyces indicus]
MEESPERPERSGGSGGRHRAVGAVFEPTRPVTRNRLVLMFLLGALVWLAAGVLAVVLLGHSAILLTLLTAVVLSWLVFGLALLGAIAVRRRDERGAPPAPPEGGAR